MIAISKWLVVITLFINTNLLFATYFSDSILNTPKGAIFTLTEELSVPANQNYIHLGGNKLQESFNQINQPLNKMHNNYSYLDTSPNYIYYNTYLNYWMESVDKTYNDCLERHRSYYTIGGNNSGLNNNIIVNNGYGNTNVIINQQNTSSSYTGSYIEDNLCIKPEHTMSILVLNKKKTKRGGIFREGYKFKVKSVKHTKKGHFHIVKILFDHGVAKGITVVSTTHPKQISISDLDYHKSSGFWDSIAGLSNIGGNYFDIALPELEYFE